MKSLPLTQMKKKYDQVEQRLLHVDSALRGRKNKQEKENGVENKNYCLENKWIEKNEAM